MRQFFNFKLLILSLLTMEPVMAQDLVGEIKLKFREIDSLVAAQNLDRAKASIYELKQAISGSDYASEDSIQLFVTSKLAYINFNMGNCDSLLSQGKEEVRLRKKIHGPDDGQTLSAMHNLGVYLINCDSIVQAKNILVQTLSLHRENLKGVDQLLLVTMDDLAYTFGILGKVDSARIYYSDLVSLLSQYSSKNDFYFHVIDNFSALLINEESYGEAAEFYEDLKTHFEGSQEYIQFLKDYYNVFIHTPDYVKGWETGKLLLNTCENHPQLCNDISLEDFQLNVARLGAVLSKHNEALDLYAQAELQFIDQPQILVEILLEVAQISSLANRRDLQLQKTKDCLESTERK